MSFKANAFIAGPSGNGKSSSYRNLPKDESTYILDCELKGLPFKGKFEKHVEITDWTQLIPNIDIAYNNPNCKYIIIDSFTKHVENILSHAKASQKGYDIWNVYNANIKILLNKIKSKDKYVFVLGIDEFLNVLNSEGQPTTARRIAVQGKEWEGKIEKEFLITLFTDVRRNPKASIAGEPVMLYQFLTNADGIASAKSPHGMFDKQYIPNDLADVVKKIEEYYK